MFLNENILKKVAVDANAKIWLYFVCELKFIILYHKYRVIKKKLLIEKIKAFLLYSNQSSYILII
jgi:hypothetical protein